MTWTVSRFMEIKIVNSVEVIVAIIMYLCVNLETVNANKFTLTSRNNINGSFCPGKIIFNCNGREVPVVFYWFVNGTQIGPYIFRDEDLIFPQVITNTPNIRANITDASRVSTTAINLESVLVGHLDIINGAHIQCGVANIMSDAYIISNHGNII